MTDRQQAISEKSLTINSLAENHSKLDIVYIDCPQHSPLLAVNPHSNTVQNTGQSQSQHGECTLPMFERLLAMYKARILEKYSLSTEQSKQTLVETLIKAEASNPGILVIEDKADEWFLTRWVLLKQFSNVELIWFPKATQVVPYLNACLIHEYDLPRLILIDLYLPDIQIGLSLLHTIKSHPIFQQIPAITLSRSDNPEDILQAFNNASDGYVVKPDNYQQWGDALAILQTYWSQPATPFKDCE